MACTLKRCAARCWRSHTRFLLCHLQRVGSWRLHDPHSTDRLPVSAAMAKALICRRKPSVQGWEKGGGALMEPEIMCSRRVGAVGHRDDMCFALTGTLG